jgi:hypothetical protein
VPRAQSAQSLKATVAALGLAADQLARAGYSLEAETCGAPQLTIVEMTAEQVAEVQAAAEVAYHGSDDTLQSLGKPLPSR